MTRVDYVVALMAKAWALTSAISGATPRDIATAIETACFEKPLFSGTDGWRMCDAFMTAISRYESGNRQVVGDCKGLKPGDPDCGNNTKLSARHLDPAQHPPQSFCFMQVYLPDGKKTAEGWNGADLMADPLKCARAAREIIRASISRGPANEPLKLYAGRSASGSLRFDLAKQLFKLVPWSGQ